MAAVSVIVMTITTRIIAIIDPDFQKLFDFCRAHSLAFVSQHVGKEGTPDFPHFYIELRHDDRYVASATGQNFGEAVDNVILEAEGKLQ